MVTIITEKLRNQSLDDVKVETVSALQTGSSNTWAFTTSPSSAFQLTGGKGWTMFLDPKERWPGQPQPTPGTTAKTTATAAGPALRGGAAARGLQPDGLLYAQPQTSVIQVPSSSSSTSPSSAKFIESCAELEAIPSTPPAPPTKRHCRSLSIPSDESKKWQPHAGQIWRPVAARPGHSSKLKSRNSPQGGGLHHHHHHHHHRPVASRGSPHHHYHHSQPHHPQPQSGVVPAAGAASGHIWPLSKSEDLATPPDSPIPRPASASSGFCDSLVNSSWLEKATTGTTGLNPPTNPTSSTTNSMAATANTTLGNNNNNSFSKLDAFRLRSLSMEEPISRFVFSGVGRGGTRSMPAIPGSKTHHSTPSSPRRQRVQRCRSQPCVLHDRKCLKRRRDEERPALDFLKMTETAYDYGGWRNSGRCLPHYIRSARSLASLFTDPPHCVLGLNTIASSPLDNNTLPAALNSGADGQPGGTSLLEQDAGSGSSWDQNRKCPLSSPVQGSRSASGSTPDFAGFVDSEDGCDCTEATECKQGEGEVFELEMNNDLDIDQIEKD